MGNPAKKTEAGMLAPQELEAGMHVHVGAGEDVDKRSVGTEGEDNALREEMGSCHTWQNLGEEGGSC